MNLMVNAKTKTTIMKMTQVMKRTDPIIEMLSRGRKAVQALFQDEHVGYYGQCFDFAVALKRALAAGYYVVLEGTDPINGTVIYHVFLSHEGVLLDASGVHESKAIQESLSRTEKLRSADPEEIERYGEAITIDFMVAKMRTLG